MLKQILKKALPLLLGLACLGPFLFGPKTASASNPSTISFQGKVVNSNGTNVTDGTYSFVFRIYNTSSPTPTTACTSDSACLWQETQASVQVTSGVFQVELGSSCALTSSSCNNSTGGPINFASNSSLYLTMQFNGDTSGTHGGFMWPVIHITSVPFALQADNASNLGGLANTNFVQLAQGVQNDASTANPSIYINKTGGSADILNLQKSSSTVFQIANAGDVHIFDNQSSAPALSVEQDSGTPDTLKVFSTFNTTAGAAKAINIEQDNNGTAIFLNNFGTGNNLDIQNQNTSVFTIGNTGFVTLQPAASLISGQTAFTQTLTNASSTGGTVNGELKTITVNNTSSASTTNGINISLTDNTSIVGNLNRGLVISLSGSNGSQKQIGIDTSVSAGIGLKVVATAGGSATDCGNFTGGTGLSGIGICAVGINASGIVAQSSSSGANPISVGSTTGSGITGYNYSNTTTNSQVLIGVKGTADAQGGSGSYKAIGVSGLARTGSSSALAYGGYFSYDPGTSSTAGSALFASNSTVAANILDLQDNTTSVFTVGDNGLITLQPAAALTGTGTQSNISQTLTNNQTGGTVNGYNQSITVSNASGTTTTNGINISLTDNTSLVNLNNGINISLAGSNTNQVQTGINVSVNHGNGITSVTTGSGGVTCGGLASDISGVCGDENTASAGGHRIGVLGRSSSIASGVGITGDTGVGVLGRNTSTTISGTAVAIGTSGMTANTGASGAYTSIGVFGQANAVSSSAITYGGYFNLSSASSATAGSALYASNSTVAANILDLQDNTTSVFTVGDGGVTVAKSNSATGFQVQDSSSSKEILTVDTSGDQVVLGKSGASGLDGKLTFKNATSTGTATITLTGNPSTNYTYQLPTGTVSSNQCLQSGTVSGGNVPLTFAACSAGGGDNGSVNGVAVTDFNLQDVASSSSVTGSTWTGTGSSPTNVTLAISNADATHTGAITAGSQTIGGVKTFQDFVILQPAASMTAGQTALTQTLTNASSTGGTVNGYSQTITVNNTSSASTTNGFNISLTDNTALANTNKGLNISLAGSNSSELQIGADINVNHGTGLRVTSTGVGGNVSCGSGSSPNQIAICAYASGGGSSAGIYGETNGAGANLTNNFGGTGVLGYNGTAGAAGGNFYKGVTGWALQSAAAAYTSVGIYGQGGGGSGSTAYGGYFELQSGSSGTLGSAIFASNNNVAANILQLQDNGSNVFIVGDNGLITLQPAANLTAGQTEVAQTLTNASSTGGTVNGYSQTITVNNTSSASTTNGFNISLTDNTALANSDKGINISLSGSNTARSNIGVDVNVGFNGAAIGLRGVADLNGGTGSVTCGNTTGSYGIGVCGDAGSNGAVGVMGHSAGIGSSISDIKGSGVYGINDSAGSNSGQFYAGVRGLSSQTGAFAYTSVGVYGKAKAGSGATMYGGYFALDPTSAATSGAALYATNSTVAANILDLQDNTTSVFTVGDGGLITASSNSASGLVVKNSSSSKAVVTVDTSANKLVLGTSSAGGVDGTLVFNTSAGANSVGFALQANPASSYTLLLPTTGPSTSQCLQTDSTTANQLKFAACSAGGGYSTVQDEGSNLTARSTINFIGNSVACVDNSGSSRTDCTVAPTLQNAYDNSGSPATITTSSSSKGILFGAGASSDSTSLFQVQNSSSKALFNADSTNMRIGVDIAYSQMTAPSSLAGTASAGGSLTASSTYKYYVTAIDSLGGETTKSNELSCADANANCASGGGGGQTISLTWTAVTGASGYKVYRTAAGGASNSELYCVTVIANSYKDTGAVATCAGALPSSNTAVTSANNSNSLGQITIGGLGKPTGQLYVGGILPTDISSGGVATSNSPHSVYVQGRYAYVATGASKLQIFDITNPAAPTDVSGGGVNTGSNPLSVYVQGHYAYVIDFGAGKLQVFDVSNPAAPTDISSGGVATSLPEGLYVQGRYAYIATNLGKLQVFDISNPANPTDITGGGSSLTSGATSLYVQGRYAYVGESNSSFEIFDISNPTAPTNVSGDVSTAAQPLSIYAQGRYMYLVGNNKLQIFDVSNPAVPTDVSGGGANTSTTPLSIFVQGRYAYVLDNGSSKFQVFDVSNPSLPVDVTGLTVNTASGPNSIYVQGRYAYVVDNSGAKLQVFDLGGEYTQQLEAGGAEFGTLQTDSNAQVAGDFNVQGGATLGQSLQVAGDAGVGGNLAIDKNLVFNNAANTNTITFLSGTTTTSYSLTLPAALPGSTGNYCIVTTNLGALSFVPCGAGNTAVVTLAAEYAGAVMTGDGSNNTGTMTSDHCFNAAPCGSNQDMNYYSWTANATNDYDIWVRWQAPSDIKSSGTFGTVSISGWTTSASDSVQLTMYNSTHTSCGSGTVSAASSSFTTASFTPISSCDVSAGQYVILDIHLNVAVNSEFARAGDIVINYNRQ